MRTEKNAKLYSDETAGSSNYLSLAENALLRPEAATGNFYRVVLPDGKKGFIYGSTVIPAVKPVKRLTIKKSLPLLSTPDLSALQKKVLAAGDKINVLASFNEFYFISEHDNEQGWILRKLL
jgi:hypothetical protein